VVQLGPLTGEDAGEGGCELAVALGVGQAAGEIGGKLAVALSVGLAKGEGVALAAPLAVALAVPLAVSLAAPTAVALGDPERRATLLPRQEGVATWVGSMLAEAEGAAATVPLPHGEIDDTTSAVPVASALPGLLADALAVALPAALRKASAEELAGALALGKTDPIGAAEAVTLALGAPGRDGAKGRAEAESEESRLELGGAEGTDALDALPRADAAQLAVLQPEGMAVANPLAVDDTERDAPRLAMGVVDAAALPLAAAAPLPLPQAVGLAVAAAAAVTVAGGVGEPLELAVGGALGVCAPGACCEEGDALGVAERMGVEEGEGGGARKVMVNSTDTEKVPAKVMSR
jgi:hypothetical protein